MSQASASKKCFIFWFLSIGSEGSLSGLINQDTASVMSFHSSAQSTQDSHPVRTVSNQQLSTKVSSNQDLVSNNLRHKI